MSDLISKLSEIRSKYNCFNEDEEPYYRALSETIRILSQLADSDTISRQSAIDAMKSINDSICEQQAIDALCELPSAQPEWKKGTWVEEDDAIIHGHCSNCGWLSVWQETDVFGMNYCPNCGVKMEVKNNG